MRVEDDEIMFLHPLLLSLVQEHIFRFFHWYCGSHRTETGRITHTGSCPASAECSPVGAPSPAHARTNPRLTSSRPQAIGGVRGPWLDGSQSYRQIMAAQTPGFHSELPLCAPISRRYVGAGAPYLRYLIGHRCFRVVSSVGYSGFVRCCQGPTVFPGGCRRLGTTAPPCRGWLRSMRVRRGGACNAWRPRGIRMVSTMNCARSTGVVPQPSAAVVLWAMTSPSLDWSQDVVSDLCGCRVRDGPYERVCEWAGERRHRGYRICGGIPQHNVRPPGHSRRDV